MEYGALMEMAVRAGEIMLASGAEVYRVEDTIHRILKHSGIARADVRRNDWIGLLIRHYTDSGRNALAMRQRRDFLR